MVEEPVTFVSAGIKIAGTLAVPDEVAAGSRVPGVVFIHGSGAVDRDENPDPELAGAHIRGIKLDVFRDLATALADGGIASLRFDKRGIGESEGDFDTRRVEDLVSDIAGAVAVLRADSRVDPDRIMLLGHSEGGMLGPRVISADPRIAGFVSCAGTVRNLREILVIQSKDGIDAAVSQGADRGELEEQHRQAMQALVESDDVTESRGWLRDWFAADMEATLGGVRCPVLVVQGEKDCQVPWFHAIEMTQVLLAAGNVDVELALFANVDHLLKFEPGLSSPARYHEGADRKTEPAVAKTIVAWCQRVAAGEPSPVAGAANQGFANALAALRTSADAPA